MPVSTPGMSQCYMVALTHLSCSRAHLFSNILCPIVDMCHQGYACLHFCHVPCCPVASWIYLFVGQPCPVPPRGCAGTPDYEATVSPAIVPSGGDRPICSSAKSQRWPRHTSFTPLPSPSAAIGRMIFPVHTCNIPAAPSDMGTPVHISPKANQHHMVVCIHIFSHT